MTQLPAPVAHTGPLRSVLRSTSYCTMLTLTLRYTKTTTSHRQNLHDMIANRGYRPARVARPTLPRAPCAATLQFTTEPAAERSAEEAHGSEEGREHGQAGHARRRGAFCGSRAPRAISSASCSAQHPPFLHACAAASSLRRRKQAKRLRQQHARGDSGEGKGICAQGRVRPIRAAPSSSTRGPLAASRSRSRRAAGGPWRTSR